MSGYTVFLEGEWGLDSDSQLTFSAPENKGKRRSLLLFLLGKRAGICHPLNDPVKKRKRVNGCGRVETRRNGSRAELREECVGEEYT